MAGLVELWWRELPVARIVGLIVSSSLVALTLAVSTRARQLAQHRTREVGASPALGPGFWCWRRLILVALLAIGYKLVVARAALFDDAFITFHYARNFAEGHGLVFNIGERVEGYTNFLWTLTIGVLHALSPFEAPAIGLVLCLVVFGLNLLLVARVGRLLCSQPAEGQWHLPLATGLLAVHGVYTSYGTSGLETGAASLLVTLGALFLIRCDDTKGAASTGTILILATLMRPDHGLFYAVGGIVVLLDRLPALVAALRADERRPGLPQRLWPAGADALVAYSIPFAVYGLYLIWKLFYYGNILPNTYYAKSANLVWFEQGRIYAASFYLGSQDWLVVLLCLVWFCRPSASAGVRRFKLFVAGSFMIYNFYVAKVGGDFMFGRFYVSLVPLYLLGAEALAHELSRSSHGLRRETLRRTLAGLTVGLLLASTQEVRLIAPREVRWGLADESTYYLIESFHPLVVGNSKERTGRFFGQALKDRGLDLILGTGGTGSVAYYSRLEVVDTRGLTDAFVAHQPLSKRGRPGHEKVAPRDYLLQRRVHLLRQHAGQRGFHPQQWWRLVQVELDPSVGNSRWQLTHYDRELMRRVKEKAPEIRFIDFELWLGHYISKLSQRQPGRVRHDLQWLRAYYFDHNDDPERLATIEGWLADHRR